jgi:hypothetical protein
MALKDMTQSWRGRIATGHARPWHPGYDSATNRATQATWADVVKASVARGTETSRSCRIGQVLRKTILAKQSND